MVAALHHLQRSDTAAAILRDVARHPARYSRAKPPVALLPSNMQGAAFVIHLPSMEEVFERIIRALAGAKGLRNGAAKLAKAARRDRFSVIARYERFLHTLDMQEGLFSATLREWERHGGLPADVLALALRAFMEFGAVRDDVRATMDDAFRPEPLAPVTFDMEAMLS